MKKKLRLSAAVLISVALVGGLFLTPREPAYQGKRLSRWLEDLTPPSQNPALFPPFDGFPISPQYIKLRLHEAQLRPPLPAHERSLAAIREIGTNALPSLVRILRHESLIDRSRERLNQILARQSLTKWRFTLDETAPQLRLFAAETLEKFGPKAGRAVPALRKRLDDPRESVRIAVTNALKAIGPELAAKASAD